MRTLFNKIKKWYYKKWYYKHLQGKMERTFGVMFRQMERAADQFRLYRYLNTPYGRQKTKEALLIINIGLDAIKKYVNLCSPDFQEKVGPRLGLISARIQ